MTALRKLNTPDTAEGTFLEEALATGNFSLTALTEVLVPMKFEISESLTLPSGFGQSNPEASSFPLLALCESSDLKFKFNLGDDK